MEKPTSTKVAVDSQIAEKIPTVFVAKPPPPPLMEKAPPITSLPVTLAKKIVNFFLDFLETIVVALSIFVIIYLFLFQPHEIKGSSMEPNFHNNEYILTDKISYRLKEPERGDVVIFKAPKNPDVDYIKRIIGLPGEQVKIQDGLVYISGEELKEGYLDQKTNLFPGSFMQSGVEITVPEDDYFVMGDNRSHSSDSREFGPVSKNIIIGRAFLRYWPLSQLGALPKATY